jgi:hypothetical protein
MGIDIKFRPVIVIVGFVSRGPILVLQVESENDDFFNLKKCCLNKFPHITFAKENNLIASASSNDLLENYYQLVSANKMKTITSNNSNSRNSYNDVESVEYYSDYDNTIIAIKCDENYEIFSGGIKLIAENELKTKDEIKKFYGNI